MAGGVAQAAAAHPYRAVSVGATTGRGQSEARRRATYQDMLDAPPHRVAEIVDGTLYTHPRPVPPHAAASSRLGDELGARANA